MKIKDYKCKCGHDDFFFVENGNNMGIYCSYCGKWTKWADKDERNLSINQEHETGKWIYDGGLVCSQCHNWVIGSNEYNCEGYNYCPYCGAKNSMSFF